MAINRLMQGNISVSRLSQGQCFRVVIIGLVASLSYCFFIAKVDFMSVYRHFHLAFPCYCCVIARLRKQTGNRTEYVQGVLQAF